MYRDPRKESKPYATDEYASSLGKVPILAGLHMHARLKQQTMNGCGKSTTTMGTARIAMNMNSIESCAQTLLKRRLNRCLSTLKSRQQIVTYL